MISNHGLIILFDYIGMLKEKSRSSLQVALSTLFSGIWPPPPKICGSPTGPPITSPRIKLNDGRHLAYKEHGAPKEEANNKIIYIHGSNSCRHDVPPLSPVLHSSDIFNDLFHKFWIF